MSKKQIAIINGGYYIPILCEGINAREYEITEWNIIPLIGEYDIVLFFLDDVISTQECASIRIVKREFMSYVKKFPCKWVLFAPQDSSRIRKRGVMKNQHRAILDACRFGYEYKKRFRCWSSFPIKSTLCNGTCISARKTKLHDETKWSQYTQPMEVRHIQLLKRYDEINRIPIDLVKHIIYTAETQENCPAIVDEYEFRE